MIENLIPAVSSYARQIDHLIMEIALVVGPWLIACEALLVYLVLKSRAKEGRRAEYITGEEPRMRRWLVGPVLLVLVCDVFLIVGALRTWNDIKIDLPEADAVVRVIGQQWAWSFVHPGPDGDIDTADDIFTTDELHVEVNKVYHFRLESRDVLHSFSVPVFRLKQDVIPGRTITGWFEAIETGTYDIQCAEICGIGHGVMAGKIVIESPQEHAAWMGHESDGQIMTASSR